MSDLNKLKSAVATIRRQAGFEDSGSMQCRDAWSVAFDAYYKLRGYSELRRVEDTFVAAERAKDPESFIWRFTEVEFGQIAHALLGHVIHVVASDSPSRDTVDAQLKRLGNPLRLADLLNTTEKAFPKADPNHLKIKPSIPEKWRPEECP